MPPPDQLLDHLRESLGFQYEIGRLLGRGGMGAVYAARERALDRDVAIKVLLPEVAGTGDARERFLREARTAARLTHPNIVPLFTFGDTGSALYFVMGLVAGESLDARLRREGRMSAEDAQRIFQELAGALAYAHQKGIIHRDIKPDNILIEEGTGRAMLTDFGIARQLTSTSNTLTQTGMIVGTPRFMSPEQAAGDRDIDARSDLYSLGLVGYTMLSGRSPFEAEGVREMLVQQMTQQPVPLRTITTDAPQALVSAVERCLKKDPAERWAGASQLLDALQDDAIDDDGLFTRLAKRGGWGLSYGATLLVNADLAWWGSQHGWSTVLGWMVGAGVLTVPLGILIDPWILRRKGMSAEEVRRLISDSPTWWPFWWPARFRRRGDVWSRLPRAVRVNRIARMVGFGLFALAIELMFLIVSGGRQWAHTLSYPLLASLGLGLASLITSAVSQYRWGKRNGLSSGESDRLAATPTWSPTFWKRPNIARFLSPAAPADAVRSSPESVAELLAAIRAQVAALPEPFEALGHESLSAARQLAAAVGALDDEIARIAQDADPAERARLERRLGTSGAHAEGHDEMRQLYAAQLTLLGRLQSRLDELTARRQRIPELLRVLWLQLSALRGDLAHQASDTEATGRIRSLIVDAERYATGMSS